MWSKPPKNLNTGFTTKKDAAIYPIGLFSSISGHIEPFLKEKCSKMLSYMIHIALKSNVWHKN